MTTHTHQAYEGAKCNQNRLDHLRIELKGGIYVTVSYKSLETIIGIDDTQMHIYTQDNGIIRITGSHLDHIMLALQRGSLETIRVFDETKHKPATDEREIFISTIYLDDSEDIWERRIASLKRYSS